MPFGGPTAISGTSCCPSPSPYHLKIYGSRCTGIGTPDSRFKSPCMIHVVGPTGSGYDETAHTDSTTKIAMLPMPTVNGTYTVYADIDSPNDAYYDQGTATFPFGTAPYIGTSTDVSFALSIPPKEDRVCVIDGSVEGGYDAAACPRTLYLTCKYGSSNLTHGDGDGGFPWGTSVFTPSADGSCGGGSGYVKWYATFAYLFGVWFCHMKCEISSGKIYTFHSGTFPTCDWHVVIGADPGIPRNIINVTETLSGTPEADLSMSPSIEDYNGYNCNSSCMSYPTGTLTTDTADTITVTS